jgi:phosphoribosylaminoimidazole-succinocarboxamide synthase
MNDSAIYQTNLEHLELIARGKVRDIYVIDDEHLLMVASDRFSAFDVVFADAIPHKGELLTEVSNFWFARTTETITNHLTSLDLRDYVSAAEYELLKNRSVIVKRLKTLPVEAIVRGYVIGSGWKDYQANGSICDIELPTGLLQAAKLPQPIFTPSSKAEVGDHDINVSFDSVVAKIGAEKAEQIRDKSIQLYRQAADYAQKRGIIIADTKFEFGVDENDEVILIDEILTPDSSRYWPADEYRPGISPPSFDKQFVRDYLETLDWNKSPPAPTLPPEIIARSQQKYQQVRDILLG